MHGFGQFNRACFQLLDYPHIRYSPQLSALILEVVSKAHSQYDEGPEPSSHDSFRVTALDTADL